MTPPHLTIPTCAPLRGPFSNNHWSEETRQVRFSRPSAQQFLHSLVDCGRLGDRALQKAMIVFYRTMFKKAKAAAAWRAMNALDPEQPTFALWTA